LPYIKNHSNRKILINPMR